MDDTMLTAVLAPLPALAPDLPATDPGLVAIRHELSKLDSISAGLVAWDLVIDHAREILAARCKHLEVACTLARALAERHGVDGLRRGATLLARFLAEFSDSCQPAAAAARLLATFDESIDDRFGAVTFSQDSDERRLDAADALARLVAAASLLTGRAMHACTSLEVRLRDGARRPPPGEPPAPPPLAAPTTPDLADPRAYLQAIRDDLFAAADRLRSDATPLALRIHRAALWQQIEQIAVDQRGAVHWGVPSLADRAQVEHLAQLSDPAQALAALDALAVASPLWLDLQRLAIQALARGDHDASIAEIDDAVHNLVRRFPQLPDLSYSDGTLLVDTATRAWLTSLRTATVAADAQPKLHAPRSLAELEAKAGRASSERRRQLLRLELARGCVRDGRRDVAVHLYAAMLAALRQPTLAAWEPGLLCTVLSEFVACARTVDEPLRRRVGADEAEDLLCALAPSLALHALRDR